MMIISSSSSRVAALCADDLVRLQSKLKCNVTTDFLYPAMHSWRHLEEANVHVSGMIMSDYVIIIDLSKRIRRQIYDIFMYMIYM